MEAIARLFIKHNKEMPVRIKNKWTGYRPIRISSWVPRWCECGRPEIKFEPQNTLTWRARIDWPLLVEFKIQMEEEFLKFELLSFPIKIYKNNILNIDPHFEMGVNRMLETLNQFQDTWFENERRRTA